MSDSHILAGLIRPIRQPLLFLKATSKKQVWIPAFTRHDGVVVAAHYAMVHVADHHDEHQIVAGLGSHSQKAAHAQLSKHGWFQALPHDHKVSVLLEHATSIQDKASAAAVLSTFKKKILAGSAPSNAEWKAFDAADAGKKAAIDKEAQAESAETHAALIQGYAKWQGTQPGIPAQPAAPLKPAEPAAKVVPVTSPYKVVGKPRDSAEGSIWSLAADPAKVAAVLGLHHSALEPSDDSGYSSTYCVQGPGGQLYAIYGAHGTISVRPLQVGGKKMAPDETTTAFAEQLAADSGGKVALPHHVTLPKPAAEAPATRQVAKAPPVLKQAPDVSAVLDKIAAAKLPESNSNHKPVNAKLDTLAMAVSAGDVKTLLMHGYGSNTYAHKTVKLANEALAALGSPHVVVAGQKMGKHAGLVDTPTVKPNPRKVVAATVKVAPVTSDEGSKDGDIKPGAGGATLIFKDGRWHRIEDTAMGGWLFDPADQGLSGAPTLTIPNDDGDLVICKMDEDYQVLQIADGIGDADYTDFTNIKGVVDHIAGMGIMLPEAAIKKLEPSYVAPPKSATSADMATVSHFTNTTPGHNKFWSVWVQGDKLITQYGKIGTQGAQSVKRFASAAAAENAKIKLINEKVAKGYVGKNLTATLKIPVAAGAQKVVGAQVKPAAPATPASSTPAVASQNDAMFQSASSPLAMDAWKKTGEQKGHNAGGTYVDESGQSWYCKFPAGGEKVARNELLATRLYALAGVATTSMRLVSQGGKIGVASKIVAGAKTDKGALLKGKADGLLSGFAVDAWLANWDTVGNNPAPGKGFDNIMIKADGSAVRIDAGGALLYGGAGGSKQTFGDKVIELKTMLDPHKNPNTAAVFGKMSPGDIAASVAKVAAIPDAAIVDFCQKFGPGSETERQMLAARLVARKADMLTHYPLAAKKPSVKVEKPKPDPTKLKVDAGQLPPLHDFMNWSGPGKPISDKPYVQENVKDETALKQCALQGNLIALKNYQFAQVDKLTGQPTGVMLPIEQHPSNHVKAYHSDLVAALTAIAFPPERPRHLVPKLVDGIVDLSKTFPSKGRGSTVANVAANERLAFWMLLGAVANVDDFRPPHTPLISSKAKQAAHAAYAKLGPTSLAKRFINRVQSSGSYNDYFRDGKVKDSQGTDLIAMNQAIHAYATEQPAGTTIHKWINMSAAQVKALVATPEGTVFENAGSMCCSTSPTGTSGFGPHRMVIRYAPGAKGVDSFGSGAFGSEAEITTLPGARYMILSSKMVHCPVKGKQRLELEVLMLPPDPTYLASLNK